MIFSQKNMFIDIKNLFGKLQAFAVLLLMRSFPLNARNSTTH